MTIGHQHNCPWSSGWQCPQLLEVLILVEEPIRGEEQLSARVHTWQLGWRRPHTRLPDSSAALPSSPAQLHMWADAARDSVATAQVHHMTLGSDRIAALALCSSNAAPTGTGARQDCLIARHPPCLEPPANEELGAPACNWEVGTGMLGQARGSAQRRRPEGGNPEEAPRVENIPTRSR